MERKIGETFEYEGKVFKVKEVEENICNSCFFNAKCTTKTIKLSGECDGDFREDEKAVIFVEVQGQPQEQAEQPQDEQPQKLNLCEVLKYCPQGETFWSPMLGDVKLVDIDQEAKNIKVLTKGQYSWNINNDGTITIDGDTSPEIMLYPSREQRDWAKVKYEKKKERFNPQTLKPFDRVLCQPDNFSKWQCNLFSHIHPDYKNLDYPVHGMTNTFMYCIPYNDETKHLLDTTDEAPDFYRYWDD